MAEKSSRKGNITALCNLGGECYELGIIVEKDEFKAFDYYKNSAENGYTDAKFQLGYCYINGIGTEINKDKGFELFNEAAGKKNTQNILELSSYK